MTTAAELAAGVRTALDGHPYAVVDETPEGFTVHLDVVDARWRALFQREGLTMTWRWIVRVRDDGTYTVTDQSTQLEWQAGVSTEDGVPTPRLRFAASYSSGTTYAFRCRKKWAQKIWAIDDHGRFAKVVDYTFDSSEGREAVTTVARRLGLRYRWNTQALIGLGTALFAVGGLLVAGVVTLVLLLFTDYLG